VAEERVFHSLRIAPILVKRNGEVVELGLVEDTYTLREEKGERRLDVRSSLLGIGDVKELAESVYDYLITNKRKVAEPARFNPLRSLIHSILFVARDRRKIEELSKLI